MDEQRQSNERERGRLHAELTAEREALLTVVSGADEEALAWPTRNPGWTVRDVLAHVLASDADLISLLEAAGRPTTRTLRMPGLEEHQREMARWTEAAPQALAREVRERGDRWQALLAALSGSALAIPVSGNWWPPPALSDSPSAVPESSSGARVLADVVADWRGHDTQHSEDVRVALVNGRAE